MKTPALSLLLFIFIATIAGAGCESGGFEPALEVGVSTCHRCQSVIAQRAWAAADRHRGEIRLYDDPGCLFATHRDEGNTDRDAMFQDHGGSGRWLAAGDAWFAWTQAFKSPQGYGWAAYPSFAAAQDAVTNAGSGRIVRFDEARSAAPPSP